MVYGVGYCSRDKYKYSDTKDRCFLTWRNMLKRCYSIEQKYDNYREQEIEVCPEWHDFYNFKQWYDRNYYEVEGEKMHLDKDIITKGNKMYDAFEQINPQNLKRLRMWLNKNSLELTLTLAVAVGLSTANK